MISLKGNNPPYTAIFLYAAIAFWISASSAYADEEHNVPATNEAVEQSCGQQENIQTASKIMEAELVEVAEEMLLLFLQKIPEGAELKFGFNNRQELTDATVGDTPYQMYVKCGLLDSPTNVWRIPILVQSQIRAFLTVDWVENSWRAVDFGAAQLAEKLSIIDDTMLKRYTLQETDNLHRVIIRDYRNQKDSFLIKSYQTVGQIQATTLLAFPEVIQEQSEWCWAGVTAAIFDYFGKGVQQCEIAEYTRTVAPWHNFGSVNCCVNPNYGCNYWNYNWSYAGSVEDILESMQSEINVQNYGLSRKMTMGEIEADLAVNRPFVIRWGWDNGGGHFLVGSGINGGYLHYMNPWQGEGNKIATYDWVSVGGGHTWTHTNRVTSVSIVNPLPPPEVDATTGYLPAMMFLLE